MFYILFFIVLMYIILIISLIIGFDSIPLFKTVTAKNNNGFTIIIPFRNEANNISELALSLMALNYSKTDYEVLWVNDASTDNSIPLLTEFLIKNAHWKLIENNRLSNSPKKDAIQTAIMQSNYSYIITTDADCILPINWLNAFNSFINNNKGVKMIAAPVSYATNVTFLHEFQRIDFLSLIGTTIGSFGLNKPFMCNGANLCYSKKAFFEVEGFDNNNNIASGDDVFLLEKINNRYPNQVKYLKSKLALVITKPVNSFKSLTQQRIRWASKSVATKSVFGKLVGIIVLLMNLLVVFSCFVIKNWQIDINHSYLLLAFISKITIDYILINKTVQFTNQKMSLKYYLFSSLLYPFFVTHVVIKSLITKVYWKGRVFD